jgi:hypothetical protein
MDQAFAMLQEMSKKDDDECDLFGKLMAKKLRKIAQPKRDQLMYELEGIILRANTGYPSVTSTDHSSSSEAASTRVFYLWKYTFRAHKSM